MENLIYHEDYNRVTEMLLRLGIKPKMIGFDYLRYAVILQADNEKLTLMKIYSIIAEDYDTKSYSVEKGIRNAITCAYNTGGLLSINEYYDMVIYTNDYKFTNLELITIICELINLEKRKSLASAR